MWPSKRIVGDSRLRSASAQTATPDACPTCLCPVPHCPARLSSSLAPSPETLCHVATRAAHAVPQGHAAAASACGLCRRMPSVCSCCSCLHALRGDKSATCVWLTCRWVGRRRGGEDWGMSAGTWCDGLDAELCVYASACTCVHSGQEYRATGLKGRTFRSRLVGVPLAPPFARCSR